MHREMFQEEPAGDWKPPAPQGRGTGLNPANRFIPISFTPDPEAYEGDLPPPSTQLFRDASKNIISKNDSPDIPYDAGINPYRGCEHGCIYCYARPYHEYLGFSSGLDFETKIMVKEDAPELLRKALSSPRWKPTWLSLSGVTDPYQPIERKLKITRRCLEVLAEYRNPVGIITKNALVTRDIDVLAKLAEHRAVAVMISITTLDEKLKRVMEPRTSSPKNRIKALRALALAGIPCGVMTAPVIPGLTDHEIPKILEAAAEAGAARAGFTILRLPYEVKALFENWLERNFPDRKEKVLNRLKEMRHGKLNNSNYGERMKGVGIFAEQIAQLFKVSCDKYGLNQRRWDLSPEAFRNPGGSQKNLFE